MSDVYEVAARAYDGALNAEYGVGISKDLPDDPCWRAAVDAVIVATRADIAERLQSCATNANLTAGLHEVGTPERIGHIGELRAYTWAARIAAGTDEGREAS